MAKQIVSPTFSFEGWNIWEFIKGRKKIVVGLVAAGLMYIFTSNEVAAIIAAPAVDMLYGLVEYYIKKYTA